jgi:hypothetical protein
LLNLNAGLGTIVVRKSHGYIAEDEIARWTVIEIEDVEILRERTIIGLLVRISVLVKMVNSYNRIIIIHEGIV